jgi:hypothetical protein
MGGVYRALGSNQRGTAAGVIVSIAVLVAFVLAAFAVAGAIR